MKLRRYGFLLLIFLISGCSQSDQTKNLELIGHRGATGLLPENTIPGFKKALEFEVDGIELDVVISGDDRVVVSHEPWFRHDICLTPEGDSIAADTRKDHLIYEMSYEQISRYDCGSLQNPDYPDQENRTLAKPLLSEVIRELESHITENAYDPVTYNVEVKSKPAWDNELQPPPGETAKLIYAVLEESEILDRVKIFAFDDRMLNEFQQLDSSIPQVYLIPKSRPDMSENLSKLENTPAVYAPNYSLVDSSLVEKVHSEGMRIIPWTVNDYEEMVRLVDTGVDGIISDYPNKFAKLKNLQVPSN